MQPDSDLIQQQARCVAHEIRNQISICDIYCEVIRKNLAQANIENPSIEKALSCIQKSTKLISNTLIDLKSINNIDPTICNIPNLLKECIELAKVYIYEKDIQITENLLDNAYVLIDENKFQACIINILKNAIESIENKGRIKINTEIENNILKISIANNGTPIKKELQENIFNDGFTTKQKGSGIGLYLCKKYFETQNATFKLKESTSKNTEFEITMNIACHS